MSKQGCFFLFVAFYLLLLIFPGCVEMEGIVCNRPYIRIADGCCLDRDDNAICDRDEPLPTYSTSSTSTSSSATVTASSTSSTTSTSSTSTSSTTTTTSSTSTTSTTQKPLPLTEVGFRKHIMESEVYQGFADDYGEEKIEIFVDIMTYREAKEYVEDYDRDHGLDCIDCFNWSRRSVWVSEFGNKDYRMAFIILDAETGTGAMYTGPGKKLACQCDTV